MRTNFKALRATILGLGVAAVFEPAAVGALTTTLHGAEAGAPGARMQSIGQPGDFKFTQPAAEVGDARAQYLLGRKYENGVQVRENYTQAARWYRQAAEQGFAPAQYSLGRLYAGGDGVRQDYAEAIRWFRRAAAQDYALAQNRLGVMYEKGTGVAPDCVEAYKWYCLAAEDDRNVFALANRERLVRQMTSEQIADGERQAELARMQFTLQP